MTTINSPLPSGYTLITADGTAGQARAIDVAAVTAGVSLTLIRYAPDRGGYVVPDAVATAYTAKPADPGDTSASFSFVDNGDGTGTITAH